MAVMRIAGFSKKIQQMSTTTSTQINLFNPTEEHAALRSMLRDFVEDEVDPQALEFNRKEMFNVELFRKLGALGLLGITVDTEYGGSGMDAVAAVIAHGIFFVVVKYELKLVIKLTISGVLYQRRWLLLILHFVYHIWHTQCFS